MNEELDMKVESLIRRYRALGADLAEIQGEMLEIKAQIDASVPIGWKHTVDGLTCSKRDANRTFDLVLGVAMLNETERETCVVTRYDDKKVRALVEAKGLIDEVMIQRKDSLPVVKL